MSGSDVPTSNLPSVVVHGSFVNGNAADAPAQAGAQPAVPTSTFGYLPPQGGKDPRAYEKSLQYPLETANELWPLPPGWIVARHEADGRLYYHEVATGQTSWVNPMAPSDQSNSGIMGRDGLEFRTNLLDTPMNAARRPDSHQCCAFVSLVLCLPMGIGAMIHSYKVDQSWKAGHYGDAVNHSRQAHNYACWGSVIGTVLLMIWWFRNHEFNFPDFDWNR